MNPKVFLAGGGGREIILFATGGPRHCNFTRQFKFLGDEAYGPPPHSISAHDCLIYYL